MIHDFFFFFLFLKEFTCTNTNEIFELHLSGTCASNDVIYLVTCRKCKMRCVGQTDRLLSMRMNSHKFNIRNMDDPSFSTNVAIRFNSNEHSVEEFS